jgi:hypothetical protein
MYRDTGMENMKCINTPVITRADSITAKCLKKNLEAGPVKHSTHSLKKTTIRETSHVVRKVQKSEA